MEDDIEESVEKVESKNHNELSEFYEELFDSNQLPIRSGYQNNQAKAAFIRLAQSISNMIENDFYNKENKMMKAEGKLMRKIREKKIAQGQKLE